MLQLENILLNEIYTFVFHKGTEVLTALNLLLITGIKFQRSTFEPNLNL